MNSLSGTLGSRSERGAAPPRSLQALLRAFADVRPAVWPVAGFLSACGVLVAGGQVGPRPGTTAISSWFGILQPAAADPHSNPLPGYLLVLAIFAFALCWAGLVYNAAWWSVGRLWSIFTVWSLPFVVGPPLLSDDVASYVAQGTLATNDLSPYTNTPNTLGPGAVLWSVDPTWRGVSSPYGPLATLFEHASVWLSHGSLLAATLLMRLIALGAVVFVGHAAIALTRSAAQRQVVLATTVASPLLMLHAVSAAHLDALVCALVIGSLWLRHRGHPYLAIACGAAAGLVKAPGFLVIPVLLAVLWFDKPAGQRAPVIGKAALSALATVVLFSSVVANGWGWVPQLRVPALGFTPAAPATLTSLILRPPLAWTGLMSEKSLASVCLAIAVLLGVVLIARLLLTIKERPVERTAGWVLLLVGSLGPVIYPWYLFAGLVCLSIGASPKVHRFVMLLSVDGALMAVPGLATAGRAVVAVAIVLASAVVLISLHDDLKARVLARLDRRSEPEAAYA